MRIQINVAVDPVCAGVPSFEEFACLLGASHGDHFSSLPIEAVVAINGVRIHERQGITSVDGQFVFVYAGPEASACIAYVVNAPVAAFNWYPTLTCGSSKLGFSQRPHPGQPSRPVG
ncbi:unnamed protein product [Schistocephalus solidus]|uniref:Uma2 domain-containing protein n=1 Tax=Schistocephalus solidus TaxID=70667 RepID=A0A183TL33_SCHSO|nr:unnamed protein product [Schistocephalus solidus]